jgi:hypothetical protein
VGRLHLRCRSTRLWLMGALSLTRRKPRGRSGLHSTPSLASTVLTRRLAPSVVRGLARTVPGTVPRRCTLGFHRSPPRVGAISPAIYPCPTLGFDPAGEARYWFAVCAGKIGSPVMRFSDLSYHTQAENARQHHLNVSNGQRALKG